MDWNEVVRDAIDGPCVGCESHTEEMQHEGMGVTRPSYVDSYLEGLTGPNEQHTVDPGAHCENPKCGYHFTPQDEAQIQQQHGEFTCPRCGWTQSIYGNEPTLNTWSQGQSIAPGGRTNSGLTPTEMGRIGEQIVLRMGELPGVGPITPASDQYTYPIDCIVTTQQGKFGCEIKSNHSTAQERFKITGNPKGKARWCLENGLKPALIGVRLNFYTDKAYIFFREGFTDTWISNAAMLHIATVDFADLNPFKSPDPQAQALAVQNANLPDQSEEADTNSDSDIDAAFGPEPSKVVPIHSKVAKKTWVAPQDIHSIKLVDDKGNHTHTVKRCPHCHVLYERSVEHRGAYECPTCGEDPDRPRARLSKVVLAAPKVDELAKEFNFMPAGRTAEGHRIYRMEDGLGVSHVCNIGSGKHGPDKALMDFQRARQRMKQCVEGVCDHTRRTLGEVRKNTIAIPDPTGTPKPVIMSGQEFALDDKNYFVQSIVDGEVVQAFDMDSGEEELFDKGDLQKRLDAQAKTAAGDPDYLFIYYMSELRIEEVKPGVRHKNMIEDLLAEFGNDTGGHKTEFEMDTTDVAAGEIFEYENDIKIEHKQLSKPEVRDEAERLIYEWHDDKKAVFDTWGEAHGPGPDRDEDTGQWVAS